MATKNLSEYNPDFIPNASEMSFGIVVADWNHEITHTLLKGCHDTLVKHGANPDYIKTIHVPGSYELPKGAAWLAQHSWRDKEDQIASADAVIILGCVITGETRHDEYICNAVSQGLMQLNLAHEIPFVFGLLTPRNLEQAQDRAGGKYGNKGVEAAVTAIKMVATHNQIIDEDVFASEDGWFFDDFLNDFDDEDVDGFGLN